jgi:hypothetical protein
MKQKLAILCALFACHNFAAGECNVIPHDNRAYVEIMERMGKIDEKAPSRVEFCGDYGLYWKVFWDAFEMPDGWAKRAAGSCSGQREGETVQLYSCNRSIFLASDWFEGELRLAHDLNIELVMQLIEVSRQSIGAQDRITAIEYTSVRDGGAWSETSYGYQVRTSDHPHHQRGEVLHLVRSCGPAPCAWTVADSSRTWAY